MLLPRKQPQPGDAVQPRHEGPPRHRWEIVLGRVFLALLATVATLLALEVASRWWRDTSAVRLGFAVDRRIAPYVMFGAGRFQGDLNSLGYRGPVAAMPKPASEYRIVLLGASAVVLGDPPVPQLVEEELHRHGYPAVRVYNYGVVGSVSGMELARLVHEVADREPDLVVMYSGGNDLTSPFLFDPRPGYPMNFAVYENNPLLRADLRTYPTGALLAYGSNLARLIAPGYFIRRFLPMEELRREVGFGSDAWKERIVDLYLGNVDKAAAFARGIDADFIGFVQPLVYFKGVLTAKEQNFVDAMEANVERQGLRDFGGHSRDVGARLVRRLAARGTSGGARVVDLSGLFADHQDSVFIDFIHTEQPAMSQVAAEMARSILTLSRLRDRAG